MKTVKKHTANSEAPQSHASETDFDGAVPQRRKRSIKSALLFFRLGDFYEMFYEDAAIGAGNSTSCSPQRPPGRAVNASPLWRPIPSS
jgi:hypothetical protein